MKKLLLILLLFFEFTGFSQSAPVQWELNVERNSPNSYTIILKGQVAKGWHVYADVDTALGLEPVSIQWENENVTKDDSRIVLDRGGEIYLDFKDPVFENKHVKIYGDHIFLEQD